MSKYGETAILAVQLLNEGETSDPSDAWDKAAKQIFPVNKDSQEKGCPRGAFLGLCTEGLVHGVEPGVYGRPSKNGDYAIRAVDILESNRFIATQPDLLWKKVAGNTKTPNHQMDIVVALWGDQLIGT